MLPHGSVREYYPEVTDGLIDIVGEVVGPYRLPQTLACYANGNSGIGQPRASRRANVLAQDAARRRIRVDFTPYDNDGNGFVDAFIVVHAGAGAEETGNGRHLVAQVGAHRRRNRTPTAPRSTPT